MPFPFLGPLVPDEVLPQALRAWHRRQWRHGPPLARFDVGPRLADRWQRPLLDAGCEVRQLDTVVIDLAHGSATDLQAAYPQSPQVPETRCRGRGGGTPIGSGEVSELLPRLLVEAYEARGSHSPYPNHTGRLVEEWLHGRQDAVALTAEVHGEPAGTLVVLGGHSTALAWVGGCFRRFRDLSANVLLYHASYLWSLEQGCSRIDLCASVDEGVLRFKLGLRRPPGPGSPGQLVPAPGRRAVDRPLGSRCAASTVRRRVSARGRRGSPPSGRSGTGRVAGATD